MCLSSVEQIYNPPDETEYEGYKVGTIVAGANEQFFTQYDHRKYNFNEWYNCDVSPNILGQASIEHSQIQCYRPDIDKSICYPLGFHLFTDLNQAQIYNYNSGGIFDVVKVKYRKIVAKGSQIFGLEAIPCVVAQEIMFLKEEISPSPPTSYRWFGL